MKIVVGLGAIEEYVRFVKAGADEVFAGYVPYEWLKRNGVFMPLNRREVLYYNVQIGAITDLIILKKMVDYYGVPVKLTFNSLYYTKEQYPLIEKIMADCIEVGFDTFIVADPGLLYYLKEQQVPCKIHVSGECGEVNHLMMEEFTEYPVKRFIFHRKNTFADMRSCILHMANKKMEYEAFILNELCHFTGGYCNSLHCDELPHLCKVPYEMGKVSEKAVVIPNVEKRWKKTEESVYEDHYVTGQTGCGLCAIRQLEQIGVTHVKLVGRGNFADYMERDIKALRKAIQLADETSSEKEFTMAVKKEIFHGSCSGHCYYKGVQ